MAKITSIMEGFVTEDRESAWGRRARDAVDRAAYFHWRWKNELQIDVM